MVPAEALKCIEGNEVVPGQFVFYGDTTALAVHWDPNQPGVHAILLTGERAGFVTRLRNEKLLVLSNGYSLKARIDHSHAHDRDAPWGSLLIEEEPLIYATSGSTYERQPIKYSLSGSAVRGGDYRAIAFTTWHLHLCDPQGKVAEEPLLTVYAQGND